MKYYVGIDLGTTNTKCTTIIKLGDGRIFDVLRLPIKQLVEVPSSDVSKCIQADEVLPSVVWLTEGNKIYTGKYCKREAGSLSNLDNSYIIKSIKREMGNHNWELKFNEDVYKAKEIAAFILKTVLLSLPEDITDSIIGSVVITIPASFSSKMRRDTIDAALLAGVKRDKLVLLDEPIAAIFSKWKQDDNIFQDIETDYPIMIFDMGGGTIDVTIIEILQNKKTVRVLATSRYNEVAGDDIDLDIAAFLLKKIHESGDYNNFFEDINNNANAVNTKRSTAFTLLLLAEKIKYDLNIKLPSHINRGLEGVIEYCQKNNIIIEENLSEYFPHLQPNQITLNTWEIFLSISPFISEHKSKTNDRNIFIPIHQALSKAGLDVNTIKYVYAVGGSAKFKPIVFELKHCFTELSHELDPDFAVSEGAAKFAYLIENKEWKISEETHEKIFIRRSGQPFLEILPDKLPIPCNPTEPIKELTENDTYEIYKDTTRLYLEFYQGSSSNDPAMSLVHIEPICLDKVLKEKSIISSIRGLIDENKIFHFSIEFKDPDGSKIDIPVDFSTNMDSCENRRNIQFKHGLVLNGFNI